jgi:hypothetical protein
MKIPVNDVKEKDAIILAYLRNRYHVTHDDFFGGEPYTILDQETDITYYVPLEYVIL